MEHHTCTRAHTHTDTNTHRACVLRVNNVVSLLCMFHVIAGDVCQNSPDTDDEMNWYALPSHDLSLSN